MQKFWIALLFFFGLAYSAQAQIEAQVREESRPMSQGSFNALVMDLPGTQRKEVESAWRKHIGQFKGGKTSFNKRSGEVFSDDIRLKEMSDNTVDVYAKVVDAKDGTQIAVWFNLGAVYLSSNDFPERYPSADRLLKDFAKTLTNSLLADELKAQEKLQKTLEKELKSLERQQKSEEKNRQRQEEAIKKAEREIGKIDERLKENQELQGKKKAELEAQNRVVNEAKDKVKQAKRKR